MRTDKLLKNDIIYRHCEPFQMVKINKNATFLQIYGPIKEYLHFTLFAVATYKVRSIEQSKLSCRLK